MDQKRKLVLILETVWWLITFIVIIAVLYPIYDNIHSTFPFYATNILFILLFITLTRLVFLLKYSFLASSELLKVAIIPFCIIIVFLLVNKLNNFQTFIDEQGWDYFLGHLEINKQKYLKQYIYKEMLFFGVGSIAATILLPFRLILSIWRGRNRGTV